MVLNLQPLLTLAKAMIVPATFLAITRQPLKLESRSNLLQIRKVF